MQFIKKNHRALFFLSWFIINIIQAAGTGLFDDEAYYWVYSKFPDWGYFDHPPMISILIKAGYALFHNELGVRLLIVVMNVLSIYIIEKLLPRKNDILFYMLCYSMALLQIGGIIAVPDIPLTFFTALFFLAYRNFLRSSVTVNALLLGLVMALMLYSKYHGILIILCVIIANPKLAFKPAAWIAVATGVILFFPHLYWQYINGFPSVQFHLFERNATSYRFNYTTEYVLGQLVMPGPLTGWLLLYAAIRYKPLDSFQKGMKYALFGIYIFFLVSTLKGRVEANWTVPAFIPLIVLSHQYLMDHFKWKNILFKTVPFTLAIVFLVRIYMLLDVQPLSFLSKDEFHKSREWAHSIERKIGNHPVVFLSTYQKASKFWFYSGKPAFSLNTPTYRRNIYNFLPLENDLIGKEVSVISHDNYDYFKDTIHTALGMTGYHNVPHYFSFSKLKVGVERQFTVARGSVLQPELRFTADKNDLAYYQDTAYKNLPLNVYIVIDDRIRFTIPTKIVLGDINAEEQTLQATIHIDLPKGIYYARLGIPSAVEGEPSLNSSPIKLIVE
ncbi:MAG: glycosyltransferase family 39 protein [Chitinophagaceae bacterium]